MYKNIPKRNSGFTILYAIIISSVVLSTVISLATIALKQRSIATLAENSQTAFYAANSGMECALYWTLHGRDIKTDVGGTIGDDTIDLFKIPRTSNTNGVFNANYDSPLASDDNKDQSPIRAIIAGGVENVNGISCFDRSIVEDSIIYSFDTQKIFSGDQWYEAVRGSEVSNIGSNLEDLCGKGFIEGKNEQDFRVWLFRTILPDQEGNLGQSNSCAEVAVCRYLDTSSLSISSRGYNTCDIGAANIVERAVRLTQE